MHFAAILPDWDSLESVRHAHSLLEIGALVFFALLVLFDVLAHLSGEENEDRKRLFEKIGLCFFAVAVLSEIVAYPYGQRNDRLSGDIIGSLSEKAKEALTNSGTALSNSGIALNKSGEALTEADAADEAADKAQKEIATVDNRAGDIDADLARTQYLLSYRSVVDPDSLTRQLKQFKGQTVHFGSYNSEPDQAPLCNELATAAVSAGMNVPEDTCGRQSPVGNALTGVVVSGPDLPQTGKLAKIIRDTSSLGVGGTVSAIPALELTVFVGAKPPFTIGQARGLKIPRKIIR